MSDGMSERSVDGVDRRSLTLATALAAADTSDRAASVLTQWLEEATGAHWWVLAIVDEGLGRVVAGPGAGAELPWVRAGAGEDTRALSGLAGATAHAADVVTPFDTWGAVATTYEDADLLGAAAAALGGAIGTLQRDDELQQAIDRLEHAQSVAHMGSYDWDIRTDTNRWSDELYRIYGHQPQSFNASYERFLSMVHPDDRDHVVAIHQEAYATGEPYHTLERVIRPSGEVRVLETTGRVIHDATGTPIRMAGVCIDVTERWHGEREAARVLERFRLLVEMAPDALLVVGDGCVVRQVNASAEALFGTGADELVGRTLGDLVGDVPMGVSGSPASVHLTANLADGSSIPVDVTVGLLDAGGAADDLDTEPVQAVVVRDARPRLEEEERRRSQHDAEIRLQQALEINDNVLQSLTTAAYTLERGHADQAAKLVAATLGAARQMVHDLLPSSGGVTAGSLVRDAASPSTGLAASGWVSAPARTPEAPPIAVRVVVVDDSVDLRMILRLSLEATPGFEVVGEAGDGVMAVEAVRDLQPDLVLLDLSMPVMDGLEALPLIRQVAPDAQVVVLSGFGAQTVGAQALAAGAVAYLEKGMPQAELMARLRELSGAPEDGDTPVSAVPDEPVATDADLLGHLLHEFATPLAAAQGLAETLAVHADRLSSAASGEVLSGLMRNVQTMAELVRRVSEARASEARSVVPVPAAVDVEATLRETIVDLLGRAGDQRIVVHPTPTDVAVHADPVHVRQILTNLLSNAIKFGHHERPAEVIVRVVEGRVEVDVLDQGTGVPADRVTAIFERFGRAHPHVPGLGLGLHIAREIARANHGDVQLVSTGPSGSTFRLMLPTTAARSRERAR